MELDESVLIVELTRRANLLLHQKELSTHEDAEPFFAEVVAEAIRDIANDASLMSAEERADLEAELDEYLLHQPTVVATLRADLARDFAEQFEKVDRCIAFAVLVSTRLDRVVVRNLDLLRRKDPRPHPEAVTGAPLKCLLLLALLNKVWSIATEIAHLMKESFLDAASSRLRTMHEHVVVLTVILNDHTYEVAERYQDHAPFEDLDRLRTYRTNFEDPIYASDPELMLTIDQEIRTAEGFAAEARTRWGSEIAEQYGWARPGLPPAVRRRKRIFFTDLERASGADFLRGDYLSGNSAIHAGAMSAINHLLFSGDSPDLARPAHYRDDLRMTQIAVKALRYLADATLNAAKGVSIETGEYDEFLIAVEVRRSCEMAADSWYSADAISPPSS